MSTYHWLNFSGLKNVQNVSVQLIIFQTRPKRYLQTGAWARFLWTSSTEPTVIFLEFLWANVYVSISIRFFQELFHFWVWKDKLQRFKISECFQCQFYSFGKMMESNIVLFWWKSYLNPKLFRKLSKFKNYSVMNITE